MNIDRRSCSYPVSKIRRFSHSSDSGFSLLEMICVALMVGLLASIAAPSWLAFANSRSLTAAQDEVYRALLKAQRDAKSSHLRQEANFRQLNGEVQWTTHSVNTAATSWQTLQAGVQINTAKTTMSQTNNIYRLRFDEQGNVDGQLGKLTLSSQNGGNSQRCVIASTLIGAFRKAQDQKCLS
jgi:prepilin-type N-terminal cleavage/methylation domain-containing protein